MGGNPINWADPFGLEEDSSANLVKRQLISDLASSYNGSTDWCKACKKDNFPSGSNKCNKYVYDVTKEAGAEARVKKRPPLAAEWAKPEVKIPNWRPLKEGEKVMPGDVAAYKLSGGGSAFSGHTGIMTDFLWGFGLSNSSAHEFEVGPVWGQFNEGLYGEFFPNHSGTVTYRRYTGE